eukprot:scaffold311668_cov37-Tisochrysis_lutea.AAC.3
MPRVACWRRTCGTARAPRSLPCPAAALGAERVQEVLGDRRVRQVVVAAAAPLRWGSTSEYRAVQAGAARSRRGTPVLWLVRRLERVSSGVVEVDEQGKTKQQRQDSPGPRSSSVSPSISRLCAS